MRKDKREHLWEIEAESYSLLYGLIRSLGSKKIVETGTFTGKATLSMAKALRENGSGFIWSIDREDFDAQSKVDANGLSKFVEIIIGETPKALEIIMRSKKNDFVFLDNGHDYEIVAAELEIVHTYLIQGGYVMGHDYAPDHAGVFRAVNEFIKKHKDAYETITLTNDKGMFLMRKL